ncbi:glycosyltransferase family 4 protein [Pseudomonas sp. 32.2.56]|uniref:glycosyltransferase family 4 protein n=1 Tax=Pseudomonas sp. 32.2.56 TaxID=2969303 RepID=UPI00214FD7D4|nr:glycosyltransferase family 4 protein [Pseudomonas sp. 32.2.56]MCR4509788.1 glycosyltransferase family 4 protein [Pseudomonas sp. 32.2.56]
MRILVLSQYFWPENFIINDIVQTLSEQGHDVVVATGKPNYPDGEIYEGYSAGGILYERYQNNIDVVRVPLWPRGRGGSINLILNYLSFVVSGLCYLPWMLRGRKFDAILVFAPSPITQAIPAILLKWLKKAKLVLWVQDLWPESLSATGFIKNPYLLNVVGCVVRSIYYFCDKLLVQSQAFVEPMLKYTRRDKIFYYPNSMRVSEGKADIAIPQDLSGLLEKYFCVVFAGNLGTAQALDTVIQAAELLRDDAEIRLVLVGSGSRLSWLKSQRQELGLSNLVLPGRFPLEAMPAIFERSSALLVSLNDEEIFAQTIPSKIQAYLAAGRPIVASINGEGARVVLEAGAGFVSAAEKVAPLVENIRSLKMLDFTERNALGKSGKEYFHENFEMNVRVKDLVQILGG